MGDGGSAGGRVVVRRFSAEPVRQACDELDGVVAHGGDLYRVARHYGVPAADWLDLSTGINPEPYPVGQLCAAHFERLPYLNPELLRQAEAYYGSSDCLPVPGLGTYGSRTGHQGQNAVPVQEPGNQSQRGLPLIR